ncbi:MAG TPA: hypothetical protein ENH96_04955, partial [Chlamydiae bacterium]|nr:hypothetical protein [Chlamydiota bacterium]
NRLANVVTYSSFINAAGKNGEFREAKVAFEEAKSNRLADFVTYSSFIDAAGKNGKFLEAKVAFEEAKSNRLADFVTYNIYINVLYISGKKIRENLDLSKEIFTNYLLNYLLMTQKNKYQFDLHGLSHGAARCFLNEYIIHKLYELESLQIICGRASHNMADNNMMRVLVLEWISNNDPLIEIETQTEGSINIKLKDTKTVKT